MALTLNDIKVELSGGTGNNDPDLSLGGVLSTHADREVLSQTAAAPTLVTGVTIDNAYANALGNGTLRFDFSTSELLWKPYGGSLFNGVVITGDGQYVIGDSNGYLVVTVVQASLPGSTVQDTDITITNIANNTFDSVSSAEATAGRIEYRCFYVHNTSGVDTAYDVRIWVKQQPIGPDELDIALDLAGKGDGSTTGVAATAVDEVDSTNQVSGLTFTRPSTQATGLVIGNLAPGEVYAFWEKRTVPAETTQRVANDISKIGLSALL